MAKGRFNRVRHLFVICMRTETELALSLVFFNNVVGYHCTFFLSVSSACNTRTNVGAHTHTSMPHTHTNRGTAHKAASAHTHIFHTRTLYGIVSISVTAEGLATRDCAGLSRHGPDFTGYKGSRLPLVSNSVLDKKNLLFEKKKLLIIITEKLQQCNFEYWLASQKHKERRSCRSNYNIYNILYLLLCIS